MLFNKKSHTGLLLIVLTVTTIGFYFRTINFDFSPLDEEWLIIKNEGFVKNTFNLYDAFANPISKIYYRPILMISLYIDYCIGNVSPKYYHLHNLLLHCLNVILLFFTLYQFSRNPLFNFMLSLLFSVHPSLIHAVVWIPGRNDLLLCLYCLASIYFLNRSKDSGNNIFLILHFLLFACSLFVKENAIVLPFIYGILLLIGSKTSFQKVLGFFIVYAGIATIWYILRLKAVEPHPKEAIGLLTKLKYTLISLNSYNGKVFFPFSQSVYPIIKNQKMLPGIISLIILIVLLVRIYPKNKGVFAAGICIYLLFLLIPIWYSSTDTNRELYEHRLYVPLSGILIVFSLFGEKKELNFKRVYVGMIGLFFIYLIKGGLSVNRYKSSLDFTLDALKSFPDSYFFNFKAGEQYYLFREYRKAVIHFSKAIKANNSNSILYNNRGNAYTAIGIKDSAISDFDKAYLLSGKNSYVLLNKVYSLVKLNEIGKASQELFVLKKCCQNIIPPPLEKEIFTKFYLDSLKKLNRLILLDSTNSDLYLRRSKIFFDLADMQKSQADVYKALTIDFNKKRVRKRTHGSVKRANR